MYHWRRRRHDGRIAVATAKKMTGPEAFKFSIACATAAVVTQGTGAPDRKTVDECQVKFVAKTI